MAIMVIRDLWDNEICRFFVPARLRYEHNYEIDVIDRIAGFAFDHKHAGSVDVYYITEG